MTSPSELQSTHSSLAGRVALVTGAGDGMGRSASLELSRNGVHVVLFSRTRSKVESVADEIKSIGRAKCAVYVGDVCNEDDHRLSVQLALSAFGSLHIVFNNAGALAFDTSESGESTEDLFDKMFSVNTKSVVFGMKHQIPAILNSFPSGVGSIINNSSIFAMRAVKLGIGKSLYSASKAAVNSFTQTMALEYGGKLRINAIAPGVIRTNIVPGTSADDVVWKQMGGLHAVGRCGEPEEVAKLVAFLASDASSFITGTIVEIDGGMKLKE